MDEFTAYHIPYYVRCLTREKATKYATTSTELVFRSNFAVLYSTGSLDRFSPASRALGVLCAPAQKSIVVPSFVIPYANLCSQTCLI